MTGSVPPLWLLVMVTASGTLGMHVFVPALPQAGRDLVVDPGTIQLTITLYLVGLAIGQLVYGPVSDRLGRRPVLFAGLGLYLLGSVLAAAAPGAWALVGARFLQAFGGCAGLVLGRAIVRDTAAPQQAAAKLAMLNLVVSVSPGVAPILGAWLVAGFGWRSIFVALAALGAATLAAAVLRMPETGRTGQGTGVRVLLRSYGRLLGKPAFLGYAVGGACTTTSIYAFMAASPFIFVDVLHRPASEVGTYYLVLILGVTLGSLIANRLIGRVRMGPLVLAANGLATLGALAMLAAVLSGWLSVPAIVVPMFLFTVGAGIASPLALTGAVSVDAKAIGAAAGLYGFGQMAYGAGCTALASLGHGRPALTAALVLTASGLIGQAALAMALRRDTAVAPRLARTAADPNTGPNPGPNNGRGAVQSVPE